VSIEVLKIIKQAEDRAELIKKEAAQKAKQIVVNSNAEASRILDEASAKAESNKSDVIKNTELEAQILYDQIIDKAEVKCKDILINAESNMDNAVSIILERIVKINGDS